MAPGHDPKHPISPVPDLEVVRLDASPATRPSRVVRLLLAAVVVLSVVLLGWFFLVYAEPVVPEGPAVDEIKQEEDDAIDSTDG